MKKLRIILFSLGLIFLLMVNSSCSKIVKSRPRLKDVPTFCFHGFDGSEKDWSAFIRAARKKNQSNCVIRANVDKHGQVSFLGSIKAKSKNPVILVNYKDNVQPNFNKNGFYVTQAVKAFRRRYFFKKVNMVGYSLGNISIVYYQMINGKKNDMPVLNKQVDIAGHFNGADFNELPPGYRSPKDLTLSKEGKPSQMNQTYREMLAVRKIYQGEKVRVLNLMGDFNNHSDGVVPNNSSRSLKYLVAGKNYHEKIIVGPQTSHGALIENDQVIRAAIHFLW